jgi:hypothetical protein
MRSSAHDDMIHTYEIADGVGLRLLGAAPPARGLLTGIAHDLDVAESRARRRRAPGGPSA